jgi:hypothetical protein
VSGEFVDIEIDGWPEYEVGSALVHSE